MDTPEILYRDGLILVVNKPAGINVHAGPSGGPSLEDTFDALRFGLPKPLPWPTGWIETHPAAWCWGGMQRHCGGWERFFQKGAQKRPIGRSSAGNRPKKRGALISP